MAASTRSAGASLVERFELDETKKGKAYSKGNRQKVALVAALASDVPLLVLDEPTAGLDPLMEEVFQSELTSLRGEGRTVLLSSHILSEVERACDRVSIVRAGRIVDTGSLAELRHLTRTRVHAALADTPTRAEVSSWPGTHDVSVDGAEVRFSVDAEHLGELVATLSRRGVASLTCQPPTLEELFLARYQAQPV